MAEGEVLVTCGGSASWPPSVMADGVPGFLDQSEATRTFQSILDDPQWGGEAGLSLFPGGVDVEWRVLRGDDSSLSVGLGRWTEQGPARNATVLRLERDGDRWVPGGWGSCNLEPVLRDGTMWVEVSGYSASGTDATSIEATVNERDCTSARDPEPYLKLPVVIESPETVTIYWTSTPVPGSAVCPSNPSVQRAVELIAPLGDREVLDGSYYPPRLVTASPS